MTELLEKQLEESKKQQNAAQEAFNAKKEEYKSAYKAMLNDLKPQVDTKKEENLRRMGKVQAWTDFVTALTNGIIGGATKGYAPQIGANAQPYAVNLENLREINKQRNENYNKLKTQADLSLLENDSKDAQAKYDRALAEEKEAKTAVQRQREIEEGRQHDITMLNRRIEASQTDSQKPPQMQTITLSGLSVALPKDFNVRDMYYNIIGSGVKGVTQKVKGNFGDFKEVDVDTPTENQMWAWVYQHPDEVLNYLRGGKSQPKTTTPEPDYETALTGLGYDADTPYVTKGKKDKKVTINPSQSYLAQYGRNNGENMNGKKIGW